MTDAESRGLRFAYFILGIAVPILGFAIWAKTSNAARDAKRTEVDQAYDITLEDSFPASDPPSAY